MRQSTRLLISGALVLVVSLTVGLVLATHTKADTFGCSPVRGPCDPRMTLPYVWPGFVLVVAGSFAGLLLLAFGVRRWAQVRASH
jgi:hypothetical protein